MSEKKNILPVLALICAVLALALSVFGLLRPAGSASGLEALTQQNAQLQQQLDALNARLDSLPIQEGLADWNLVATAWESGAGADVTMSAAPGAYEDGMSAIFSIRLEGQEVRSIPCEWDGTAFFTAEASLDAADGYGYYCILIDADGERQQFALSTPENPVMDVPVYLKSSMSAYCNMTMDSWMDDGSKLTVSLAFVQAQLPRLSVSGDMPGITSARLLLTCNGNDVSELPVTLEAGEGAGAYELTITGAVLALPDEMSDDDYLDLFLEIKLTDGTELTALGGSWYQSDDGLFLVVG